jgi:CRP/FNR family transcriptional regulator, cyclic AMP receptor protein
MDCHTTGSNGDCPSWNRLDRRSDNTTTLRDMDEQQVASELRRSGFFRGMDLSDLLAVAKIVEERPAPAGQHVFFQGDIATEFFIVSTGRIRVYVPGHGEELEMGIVGESQMFGEGGMLDGGPRVASAVALDPSVLLTFARWRWLRMTTEMPDLAERMLIGVGASLRRYASAAVDLLFLDVEIPEFPPETDRPHL